MIQVVSFDSRPVVAGESRDLMLDGNGPFTVSTSCFVENPPPPGFRSCPECLTQLIPANRYLTIAVSPTLWQDRRGRIEIQIVDAVGEQLTLRLGVITDTEATPMASAGAA
jgi:hypothetical protein